MEGLKILKILGVHRGRGGGGGGHTQYFNVVKARATPGSPASCYIKWIKMSKIVVFFLNTCIASST